MRIQFHRWKIVAAVLVDPVRWIYFLSILSPAFIGKNGSTNENNKSAGYPIFLIYGSGQNGLASLVEVVQINRIFRTFALRAGF